MNVYECRLCGKLLMQQGLVMHMIKVHRLHPEFYGPSDIEAPELRIREPDLVIQYNGVPRGKGGRTWTQGYTVAYWSFQVKAPYGTRFVKGDLRLYRLWITQRIRYVREKYGRGHLEPTYLEDYPEIFQEAQQ